MDVGIEELRALVFASMPAASRKSVPPSAENASHMDSGNVHGEKEDGELSDDGGMSDIQDNGRADFDSSVIGRNDTVNGRNDAAISDVSLLVHSKMTPVQPSLLLPLLVEQAPASVSSSMEQESSSFVSPCSGSVQALTIQADKSRNESNVELQTQETNAKPVAIIAKNPLTSKNGSSNYVSREENVSAVISKNRASLLAQSFVRGKRMGRTDAGSKFPSYWNAKSMPTAIKKNAASSPLHLQAPAVSLPASGLERPQDPLNASREVDALLSNARSLQCPRTQGNDLVIKFSEDSDSDEEESLDSVQPAAPGNQIPRAIYPVMSQSSDVAAHGASDLTSEISRIKKQIAAFERLKGKPVKPLQGNNTSHLQLGKGHTVTNDQRNSIVSLDVLRQKIATKESLLQQQKSHKQNEKVANGVASKTGGRGVRFPTPSTALSKQKETTECKLTTTLDPKDGLEDKRSHLKHGGEQQRPHPLVDIRTKQNFADLADQRPAKRKRCEVSEIDNLSIPLVFGEKVKCQKTLNQVSHVGSMVSKRGDMASITIALAGAANEALPRSTVSKNQVNNEPTGSITIRPAVGGMADEISAGLTSVKNQLNCDVTLTQGDCTLMAYANNAMTGLDNLSTVGINHCSPSITANDAVVVHEQCFLKEQSIASTLRPPLGPNLDSLHQMLKDLREDEQAVDKELEEARKKRRRCELQEQLARRSYMEAKEALHMSNLRCDFLYQKREMLDAQIRSAELSQFSSRGSFEQSSLAIGEPIFSYSHHVNAVPSDHKKVVSDNSKDRLCAVATTVQSNTLPFHEITLQRDTTGGERVWRSATDRIVPSLDLGSCLVPKNVTDVIACGSGNEIQHSSIQPSLDKTSCAKPPYINGLKDAENHQFAPEISVDGVHAVLDAENIVSEDDEQLACKQHAQLKEMTNIEENGLIEQDSMSCDILQTDQKASAGLESEESDRSSGGKDEMEASGHMSTKYISPLASMLVDENTSVDDLQGSCYEQSQENIDNTMQTGQEDCFVEGLENLNTSREMMAVMLSEQQEETEHLMSENLESESMDSVLTASNKEESPVCSKHLATLESGDVVLDHQGPKRTTFSGVNLGWICSELTIVFRCVSRKLGLHLDHVIPLSQGDLPNVELGNYSHYESPLSMFKGYRICPRFSSQYESPTWSNQINPFRPLCKFEHRGKCNDQDCPWQHTQDYTISSSQALLQLQTYIRSDAQTNNSDVDWNTSKRLVSDALSKCILSQHRPKWKWDVNDVRIPIYRIGNYVITAEQGVWRTFKHLKAALKLSGHLGFLSSLSIQRPIAHDMPCIIGRSAQVAFVEYSAQGEGFHCSNVEVVKDCKKYLEVCSQESKYVDQSLDIALSTIEYDIDHDDASRHKKALFVLSRALRDHPSSVKLWVVYLSLYHRQHIEIRKDDMFQYSVQCCNGSYELWCLYINSRIDLLSKVESYEVAIVALCNSMDIDGTEQSSCILDLTLKMLYCMSMSEQTELYLDWIKDLMRTASTHGVENTRASTLSLLKYLKDSELCIFWVSCAYLLAYNRLPDNIVERFGCKQLLTFDLKWDHEPIRKMILDVGPMKLLNTATSVGVGCLPFESHQPALEFYDSRAKQVLAVNYVQCAAVCDGPQHALSLACNLLTLYPICVELVLVSARMKSSLGDFKGGLDVFIAAVSKWPNSIPGIQRLWNQYAGYALKWQGENAALLVLATSLGQNHATGCTELGIKEIEACADSMRAAWQSIALTAQHKVSSTKTNSVDYRIERVYDHQDGVYALINLALFEVLIGDIEAAQSSLEKCLRIATDEDLKQCQREFSVFQFYCHANHEGGLWTEFCRKTSTLLDDCYARWQFTSRLVSLNAKFLGTIEKRRCRTFIHRLLGPSPSDNSVINIVLDSLFGIDLLPVNLASFEEMVDFVGGILEVYPANAPLALSFCKITKMRIGTLKYPASLAAAVHAVSLLITALMLSCPTAPEGFWVEAGSVLEDIGSGCALSDLYYNALVVYPYSAVLWRKYIACCGDHGDATAALEAAKERGIVIK